MILKIERYNNSQTWWMYDNIKKVSISKCFRKAEMAKSENIDFHTMFSSDFTLLFDIAECGCKYENQCDLCSSYIIIICRLNDGSEMPIAFDTIAYLLNDNGKTIEKIVANHRP